MNAVRVAVVQSAPVAFDRDRTLEKTRDLWCRAAGKGAQLILFPEAFVSGYPRGLDFGARVGSRTPEGRELFRRYWESAVDVPGPATEALGEAARQANAHVVIGVIERDGGTLYCSVLFFAPDGTLMGKHRKLMPTAAERLVWGFGDGSTMPVFDTPIGRIGAVICWENYMPLLADAHVRPGNPALLRSHGRRPRDLAIDVAAHRARGPLLRARLQPVRSPFRLPGRLSGDPGKRSRDDHVARRKLHHRSRWDAILAGPDFDGPAILVADLDLDEIARGKFDFDVVGHYARPDVFRLVVDERPKSPVVWTGEPHT